MRGLEEQVEAVHFLQRQFAAQVVDAQADPGEERFVAGGDVAAAGDVGEGLRAQEQAILRPLGPEDGGVVIEPALVDHAVVVAEPGGGPVVVVVVVFVVAAG